MLDGCIGCVAPPVETGGYKMIDALPVIIWMWLRHYKFQKNVFGCCVNILGLKKNHCVPFIENLFSAVEIGIIFENPFQYWGIKIKIRKLFFHRYLYRKCRSV